MNTRVRITRQVYRTRVGSPGAGDVAYRIYLAALTFVIVGVPLLWGLIGTLRTPDVASSLVDPDAGSVVAFAGGALLVMLALFGPVRGPALPSPWFAWTLASNDSPRSSTLARLIVWSATTLVSATALAVTLIVGSAASADAVGPRDVVLAITASTLFAVCATGVWLAGQVVAPRRAWLLPTSLAALLAASVWADSGHWWTPWGWLGRAWPSNSSTTEAWFAVGLLATAAAVCGLGMAWLLRQIHGQQLVSQSTRWSAATSLASTGDLAGGASTLRVMPSGGRARAALGAGGAIVRYLRADAVAAARTPVRCACGLLIMLTGAWIVARAPHSDPVPAWIIGALGALVAYAGAGPLTDGVRHAAASIQSPCLFGHRRAALIWLRLTLPCCLSVVVVALASVGTHTLAGVIAAGGASLGVVGLRAADALKGPLPVEILTPVNTPLGDSSGIAIMLWHNDGVICAAVLGALVAAATGQLGLSVVVAAAVLGVVAAVMMSRLNAAT